MTAYLKGLCRAAALGVSLGAVTGVWAQEATVEDPSLGAGAATVASPLTRFGFGPAPVAADGLAPGLGAPLSPETPAALRPTPNLYGMTGLIDMPSAEAAPDGELTNTISYFGNSLRTTLSFQITPRLSGAFRYAGFYGWNANGFVDYYDRSFDLKYQIARERGWMPAIAVGLQDFVGTGIYAGEYVVATKTLAPGLTGTVGLGWGRLGSYNSIGSPFGGTRTRFVAGSPGGNFAVDQWFRGPAAPFAGLEYRRGRWAFKAEYSSDIYRAEDLNRNLFDRQIPYNFGAEYQLSRSVRTGLYAMYGSEVGFYISMTMNPGRSALPITDDTPGPIAVRIPFEDLPEGWTTDWVDNPATRPAVVDALRPLLDAEGLTLIGLRLEANEAEVRFENRRHGVVAQAIGRAARAMARTLPATVETFHIVVMDTGLPVTQVSLRRSDLEALDTRPDRVDELWAVTQMRHPSATRRADLTPGEGAPARFTWGLESYTESSLFDPNAPIRLRIGAKLRAGYEFFPGLRIDGELRKPIVGNLNNSRPAPSLLPAVRTDNYLYNQELGTSVRELTLSYATALENDFYLRGTVGILEKMYGGASAELLWKPVNSRLALGAEINYARQRDFDQRFSFLNYRVVTGHVSAYYQAPFGFDLTVDAGRYLAGDVGATLRVERRFANGWRLGAFATKTNVSAREFGEGSFDKGITLRIPLDWMVGRPTKAHLAPTIRPTTRDGGAKLSVPGRLYERVREAHGPSLGEEWARVWR